MIFDSHYPKSAAFNCPVSMLIPSHCRAYSLATLRSFTCAAALVRSRHCTRLLDLPRLISSTSLLIRSDLTTAQKCSRSSLDRTDDYRCTMRKMTMKTTHKARCHSLALQAHSLAPLCSLRSRVQLRSFTRSRAHREEVFVYEMNASISNHFNPQCDDGCAYLLAHS